MRKDLPPGPRNRGRSASRLAGVILAMACLSAGLACWLDPALHDPVDPALLWRNALPWFLAMLLILGLSGRALLSLALGSLLAMTVYQLNGIKQLQLNVPLLPGDLVLWRQLVANADFFAGYAGQWRWLAAGMLALFAVLAGATWLDGRRGRLNTIARAVLAVVGMLGLVTLYRGDGPWGAAYARSSLPAMQIWDAMQSVQDVGFAAVFIRSAQEMHASTAARVDTAEIVRFASEQAPALAKRRDRPVPAELPDIVVVQSEAFFDPALLKGIEAEGSLSNFRALAAAGISGSLRVNAYGGGTIRTEFEVLTGYPMAAFPAVAYPYYGLAAGWMPSMPRRLAALGYDTALHHPFRGNFWNRRQAMPRLGFSESHYVKSFADSERLGPHVSDRALFERLLAALKRPHERPQFVMGITMQNHGPWNGNTDALPEHLQHQPMPPGLSGAGARELGYYLAHLASGDAALGDFARALMARPRWTVLVFYGDHLPNLTDAFADLGFHDDGAATRQPTRYFIISNRLLEPRELDIDAFQLPGLVFDAVQLPMDGYLAIGAVARERVAAGDHGSVPAQIAYDAARAEVACGRVLDASGGCR